MMGDSAGRSARHPVGRDAERRYTQRERDLIDPAVMHRVEDHVPGYADPFAHRNTMVDYVAAGVCVVLLAMLVLLIVMVATA